MIGVPRCIAATNSCDQFPRDIYSKHASYMYITPHDIFIIDILRRSHSCIPYTCDRTVCAIAIKELYANL